MIVAHCAWRETSGGAEGRGQSLSDSCRCLPPHHMTRHTNIDTQTHTHTHTHSEAHTHTHKHTTMHTRTVRPSARRRIVIMLSLPGLCAERRLVRSVGVRQGIPHSCRLWIHSKHHGGINTDTSTLFLLLSVSSLWLCGG